MLAGVHPIFIIPWFVVAALIVGLGVRRAMKDGAVAGLKTAAIALVLGLIGLAVLFAAIVIVYYAMGGH